MTPVGMTPTFGQLTTTAARSPMGVQQFQSKDVGIMSSLSQTPQQGADVNAHKEDYAGILVAQGGAKSQSSNPIVRFFSEMAVNKMMSA